jgi:hypothetical protein
MKKEPEPIKNLEIHNLPPKVQVMLPTSEVVEREQFVIVADWIKPKYPNKPTYAYTLSNMIKNFEAKGYIFENVTDLMVIQIKAILKHCKEVKIYDNRNVLPYPVIAHYMHGIWIKTEHPFCETIIKKL